MNHLREFNRSYYFNNDTIRDLHDICLELTDDGLEVNIYVKNNTHKPINKYSEPIGFEFVVIDILRKSDCHHILVGYDEIEEVVERIKDYIKPIGFNIRVIPDIYDHKYYKTMTVYFDICLKI